MDKMLARLKQAFEDHPLETMGVGALVIGSVAKLMDANTSRKNQRVWKREVDRRNWNKRTH